jgi:hypothetical protein
MEHLCYTCLQSAFHAAAGARVKLAAAARLLSNSMHDRGPRRRALDPDADFESKEKSRASVHLSSRPQGFATLGSDERPMRMPTSHRTTGPLLEATPSQPPQLHSGCAHTALLPRPRPVQCCPHHEIARQPPDPQPLIRLIFLSARILASGLHDPVARRRPLAGNAAHRQSDWPWRNFQAHLPAPGRPPR